MRSIELVLAIHDHQPVGNFGHVFAQAYDDSYAPFLELVADHPNVRLALHHTGPLLEWFAEHRPGYLRDLRSLVLRGQVEVLGGGFYEPMLSVLPTRDAVGQIHMMADFCEAHLGVRPRGMWLAERVWEPDLPRVMALAGVAYTLADDTHFRYAGLLDETLYGFYITEKAGDAVGVFPIDKGLRYHIPFQPAEACIEYLRGAQVDGEVRALTYGDDGEKFGLWPGTKEWVWKKGWLKRFFTAIEANAEWLTAVPPGHVFANHRSSGRIYLPTASYEEMTEWALPTDAGLAYADLKRGLEQEGRLEPFKPFLRGGFWPNFMVKYPEANRIHKKMLRVSEKVDRAAGEGREALYRGQCNCAYWHGLFGGLYLNYLRAALYRNLIEAEVAADAANGVKMPRMEQVDIDRDGTDEIVFENAAITAVFVPHRGGGLYELDCRPTLMNVTDVLGRHPEAYHEKVRNAPDPDEDVHGEGVTNIHDLVRVKEKGLEKLLIYDAHERLSFADRPLGVGAGPDALWGGADDPADFDGQPYAITAVDETRLALRRDGHFYGHPLTVEKTFSLEGDTISAAWRVTNGGEAPVAVRFAVDFALTLLAGDAPDRYYLLDGERFDGDRLAATGQRAGVATLSLVDEWSRTRIDLAAPDADAFWFAPLETVSQSEDGFERTWQGSQIAPVHDLRLAPGATGAFTVRLVVAPMEQAPKEQN